MDRKEFLRNTAILGGATILPMNNVFSQNVTENGIDRLVDSNGNFIQKSWKIKISVKFNNFAVSFKKEL